MAKSGNNAGTTPKAENMLNKEGPCGLICGFASAPPEREPLLRIGQPVLNGQHDIIPRHLAQQGIAPLPRRDRQNGRLLA